MATASNWQSVYVPQNANAQWRTDTLAQIQRDIKAGGNANFLQARNLQFRVDAYDAGLLGTIRVNYTHAADGTNQILSFTGGKAKPYGIPYAAPPGTPPIASPPPAPVPAPTPTPSVTDGGSSGGAGGVLDGVQGNGFGLVLVAAAAAFLLLRRRKQ